ncbi:hypothetical protein LWC33_22655 [Pseudonocardia sp. RS11V-5]|uniref:hypothetical protein n=1 Tax=Pseudonocardia terrae TaxID=2905831 RepID=UPI001E2A7999|nr:hypothetical protein [Pseudonocardia terrae]MCE3554241.1 hypothetical protein [Pseudonocardia terrae]
MSRRELDAVVERLSAAAADAARVARTVHASWWDARGAEFAERLALVGRELARQADAVAELARGPAPDTVGDPAPVDAPAGPVLVETSADPAPIDIATGPVLPGTGGRRTGEARGVRLPLLHDEREPAGPA